MPDLRERRTILVADDVPENIELLSSILEHDYNVKVATHGEKVVEIVYSDAPPDLILLDVMMPRLSGHEVCQRIKANGDRNRIPIIFVTTMTSVEDEKLGFELGAVDYITKPISPPIVLARVRTHLALYDQSRELERMVQQRTAELTHSRQQIIRKLSRAAEFKDNETGNHVLRMAHYSMMLAAAINLPKSAQDLLGLTAPMHDVGKIGIPDHILLKPGKLDAAGVGADEKAPHFWRRDPGARGRPSAAHRTRHCTVAPRTLGRHRLSVWPQGRGYSAGRAHRGGG